MIWIFYVLEKIFLSCTSIDQRFAIVDAKRGNADTYLSHVTWQIITVNMFFFWTLIFAIIINGSGIINTTWSFSIHTEYYLLKSALFVSATLSGVETLKYLPFHEIYFFDKILIFFFFFNLVSDFFSNWNFSKNEFSLLVKRCSNLFTSLTGKL